MMRRLPMRKRLERLEARCQRQATPAYRQAFIEMGVFDGEQHLVMVGPPGQVCYFQQVHRPSRKKMQKVNPDRKNSEHITDHDLERYHLGMIVEETELASLEEHLLACSACAERAEATADYIDLIRRGMIEGDHNL